MHIKYWLGAGTITGVMATFAFLTCPFEEIVDKERHVLKEVEFSKDNYENGDPRFWCLAENKKDRGKFRLTAYASGVQKYPKLLEAERGDTLTIDWVMRGSISGIRLPCFDYRAGYKVSIQKGKVK